MIAEDKANWSRIPNEMQWGNMPSHYDGYELYGALANQFSVVPQAASL